MEFRGGEAGAARICSVALGRHQISHDHDAPEQAGPRFFKFVFQEEGECRFDQGGSTFTLRAGEWCIYEKTQSHRISTNGFSRQTAMLLPYDPSRGDCVRWETHLMRSYPTRTGASHILHDSLCASITEISCLSEASRYLVGVTLANLAELTLLDRLGIGAKTTCRETLRARVVAHIRNHLVDPDLDVDLIAAAMGCSKRYLHKIFSDQGTTLAKLIWSMRLERCYVDLGDPAKANVSITDVAYSWGFGDSCHFSRAFKVRYGVTPREFRRTGHLGQLTS
jgi:AraC family transcriptional regulator, positive regulator of tynA and feaB